MLLGYNTNGFAHHRLEDAVLILNKLRYRSIAITLDHHALNPYDPHVQRQIDAIRGLLDQCGLASAVETGARFLLDPFRKHRPTLVDRLPRAAKRLDFLKRAVDIAK